MGSDGSVSALVSSMVVACSPGASSSTTSYSASPPQWGSSCQTVPRTHSWASVNTTYSGQGPAPSS